LSLWLIGNQFTSTEEHTSTIDNYISMYAYSAGYPRGIHAVQRSKSNRELSLYSHILAIEIVL